MAVGGDSLKNNAELSVKELLTNSKDSIRTKF